LSQRQGGQTPTREQLAQAYAQLEAIKRQIEELQAYAAQLESTINSLEVAKGSVEAVKSGVDDMLMPGDPGGTVYIKVAPARRDAVLLHLGLNIYVYLSPDDAIKILEERRSKLRAVAERVKGEIEKLAAQYAELERTLAALEQAAIQAVLARERGEKGEK
jgi:prefoldin alpha subunit